MSQNPTQKDAAESLEDFFGEPISVYTDAEALEDGTLVDLAALHVSFRGIPVNRMTRHCFDALQLYAQAQAVAFDGDESKAFASIIRTKCQFAQGSEGNTGEIGDIFTIPPKLWLVRNEVAGWTLMFPEDY